MLQIHRSSRTRLIALSTIGFLAIGNFSTTRCPAEGSGNTVSFAQDVRPILSEHCFACHGPDEQHREAGLRLDRGKDAYDSGAIVAGDLTASGVWQRITSDDASLQMPPPEFNKPLDERQRSVLREWIASGAPYEEHWAFVPPERPAVPDVDHDHPIDAFLARRQDEAGLTFAPAADKRTLIRRVTLDLTGLPPTPSEVEAFVDDPRPDAYERLIERLFSRVTYGEHMARYWLDLARYADTHGLHLDNERSMWPYRDWVVRAFNNNLPFDDFTRWQIAGDLLPEPTRDQLIASGFNRCNVSTSEGGSIDKEWIFRYAVDRTTTTAEVWMGLTAGCAVCHDHKFDPLSTKDYYSLYAFFHSAADPAMDGNRIDTPPVLKLYSQEQQSRIDALQAELNGIKGQIDERFDSFVYVDPATQDPRPEPETIVSLWFEDAFPSGAKVQSSSGELMLVQKASHPVFSGEVALRRTAEGVQQDYYSSGAQPLIVPANGKLFVHCYLDPDDTPDAVMIQFHSTGWSHRAVWGQHETIPFGKINTAEKRHLGDLPETGKWVRLEVDCNRIGLKPGTKVTGYAFTQHGGTVTWDKLGVQAKVDRANDPNWSWKLWKERRGGKNNPGLPTDLKKLVRAKHPDTWTEQENERVWHYWRRHLFAAVDEVLGGLPQEQAALEREIAAIEKDVPVTMVMADLPEPRESFVMKRGQYDQPGEAVRRDVPDFLPPLRKLRTDADPNRLDLANWLVSGTHPLTARVAVNRFWQQFFGTGIVRTSGDFGSQGEPPTHPRLLDYLAVDFSENDWDVRRLIRLILTSQAYRQSSQVTEQHLKIDPENRLLARAPRLRLDAEVLRDQVLHISGLLVTTVGGKSVKPYQPPDIWEPVGFGSSNTRYYQQDKGDALYRRSLYCFLKRTAPPPFMSTFDAPNREQACTLRGRSNTPMQALQLMNDVQHVEAARHFAGRIVREGGATPQQRIDWAWQCVTARSPEGDERDVVLSALDDFQKRYRKDAAAAKKLIAYGDSPAEPDIDPATLAAYTMVANLLFNLDEAVTKN